MQRATTKCLRTTKLSIKLEMNNKNTIFVKKNIVFDLIITTTES